MYIIFFIQYLSTLLSENLNFPSSQSSTNTFCKKEQMEFIFRYCKNENKNTNKKKKMEPELEFLK